MVTSRKTIGDMQKPKLGSSLMSCSARSGFAAMSQISVPVRRRRKTGCHSSALTTRHSKTTIVHRIASCPKPSPL